jgi:hypothetical protein
MFCLAHPRLLASYVEASLAAGTFPILPHPGSLAWMQMGIDDAPELIAVANDLAEKGVPLINQIAGTSLSDYKNRLEESKALFDNLQPGITHFYLHPSIDTPELRAIAPDWRCRVADYEVFASDELMAHVKKSGVQLIGYRPLLELAKANGALA